MWLAKLNKGGERVLEEIDLSLHQYCPMYRCRLQYPCINCRANPYATLQKKPSLIRELSLLYCYVRQSNEDFASLFKVNCQKGKSGVVLYLRSAAQISVMRPGYQNSWRVAHHQEMKHNASERRESLSFYDQLMSVHIQTRIALLCNIWQHVPTKWIEGNVK